jgi:hypothetical protein
MLRGTANVTYILEFTEIILRYTALISVSNPLYSIFDPSTMNFNFPFDNFSMILFTSISQ